MQNLARLRRARSLVREVVSISFRGNFSLGGSQSNRAEYRTFAARRTLEPGANFGQIQSQFRHGAAQGIAVHPQLFGGLALVTPVCHQNFAQILLLEFANGILVGNAAGMHLRHQAGQFSFHVHLLLLYLNSSRFRCFSRGNNYGFGFVAGASTRDSALPTAEVPIAIGLTTASGLKCALTCKAAKKCRGSLASTSQCALG